MANQAMIYIGMQVAFPVDDEATEDFFKISFLRFDSFSLISIAAYVQVKTFRLRLKEVAGDGCLCSLKNCWGDANNTSVHWCLAQPAGEKKDGLPTTGRTVCWNYVVGGL